MLIPTETRIAITKLRPGLPSKSPLAAAFIYSPRQNGRRAPQGYARRKRLQLTSVLTLHPASSPGDNRWLAQQSSILSQPGDRPGRLSSTLMLRPTMGGGVGAPRVAARKIEQRRDG